VRPELLWIVLNFVAMVGNAEDVARGEPFVLDPHPVDAGAVPAIEVLHKPIPAVDFQAAVSSRDVRKRQLDIAIRMPSDQYILLG